MSRTLRLDEVCVKLCQEIESILLRNTRAPEVAEYRRGVQEALTELKNSGPMSDLLDALKAMGWTAPRKYWDAPPEADQEASS
jgi:hypothetical protein